MPRAHRLEPGAARIALALARAVVPPGRVFGGADESTVERLEHLLAGFGPGALRGYGQLLRAVDVMSRGARGAAFTRLDRDEAEELLVRWADAGPVRRGVQMALTTPVKLAYFDDHAVYEQLGSPWDFANAAEPARWKSQVTAGSEIGDDVDVECDVVVVGTGAGGAVVAKELADRGHAVVMLEEGDYHGRDAFTGRGAENVQQFYRDRGATGSLGNTVIPIPMGRMVGGSTAINTGTCWRTPDWILQSWVDGGLSDLSPDRMAPYFDRVERELQVEIADERFLGGVARVVARGCDALGYSHRPLRRNAPGCDGSGICDYGCPTGAKRSTDVSYVPAALQRGAGLFTGVRCERILFDDAGRAIGVRGRSTTTGRTLTVRAAATVLSCGTLLTPVLLQRHDLHRRLRQVGRNLSIHPATTVSALFDEEIRGYAAIPQGYCIDEFQRDGILMMGASAPIDMAAGQFGFLGTKLVEVMEAYDRVASFGVMVEDRSRGRVRPGIGGRPLVLYWLGRRERELLLRGTEAMSRIYLAAGATEVYPALAGHRVVRTTEDLARLAAARPAARDWLLMAFHPLGTCRMATSPQHGVVDTDNQVFGVPNLYIADGSVVPSSLAVNPQVTIMAFATRAADLLAERLERVAAAA